MKLKNRRKSIAVLAGSTVVVTLGAVSATHADTGSLFAAEALGSGYLLADKHEMEGKCGASDESKDSGEGKCGASEDKTATEGKCGASDNSKDDAEGKCGEGKCGGAA
ncbi:MAG: hypothetical protein PVF57_19230 [Pseudomonadales bacterium]|jgi:uncharacterized low-complexity protein